MKSYVLITGATSGIGYELAKVFAENNHDLIIVARNEKKLEEVAGEFRQRGVDVKTITHDLSLPDAAEILFEKIKEFQINILVNNAGVADYGPFIENKPELMLASIRLNVESTTYLTRLLLAGIVQVKGKILNVASTAAFQPGPLMAVYYATKAYVLSFSEALRYEVRETGVTVTTLCPGATDTSFQKKAHFDKSNLVKMGMMKASEVARAGYHGLMEGKSVVVPGLKNKIGVWAVRFAPRNLLLSIIYKLNRTEES